MSEHLCRLERFSEDGVQFSLHRVCTDKGQAFVNVGKKTYLKLQERLDHGLVPLRIVYDFGTNGLNMRVECGFHQGQALYT